jgi:hypothetical protein
MRGTSHDCIVEPIMLPSVRDRDKRCNAVNPSRNENRPTVSIRTAACARLVHSCGRRRKQVWHDVWLGGEAMSELAYRRARCSQTRGEIERLQSEILAWHRPLWMDLKEKHGRQLNVLLDTLKGALAVLRTELDGAVNCPTAVECYRACRQLDLGVLWVRALWQFFRPKFEQRRDQGLRSVLQAADEIVWACYATAYERLKRKVPPPPLSYVEPQFSPRAIPLDEPPPEFRALDVDFLQDFVAQFPVAVIGLPVGCVKAPWLLANAAHEVGHHLQHELNLVASFGKTLSDAVKVRLGPDHNGQPGKWELWGQEIFADTYALLCVGWAAPRTLAEMELGSAAIGNGSAKYPPTLIRLEWQQAALRALAVDVRRAVGTVMDEELMRAGMVLEPATVVARSLAQPLGEMIPTLKLAAEPPAHAEAGTSGGTKASPSGNPALIEFKELADWSIKSFAIDGSAAKWSEALREGRQLQQPATRRTVMGLVAAGVAAWDGTLDIDDDLTREKEQTTLANAFLTNVRNHAEPGDRNAGPVGASDYGGPLGSLLLGELRKRGTP